MSTSYKPALLKALVRIVRRSPELEIPLLAIGAEFVSLYWVQTVVFRLRQASTISRQPEVVSAIRFAADASGVRRLVELPDGERAKLDAKMAKILRINVLAAFHRSKPAEMTPLFSWDPGAGTIRLTEDARDFISTNAMVLESLANLWWAGFLEKRNMLAPLVIEKVRRQGAERRGSLTRFLRILLETDERRCFYCETDLAEGTAIHVDHVIPWSFLLVDELWDLVLACVRCNLAKSDILPQRAYLDKLAATSVARARSALPHGVASAFLPLAEIDRFYDAALAVEWPSGWSP